MAAIFKSRRVITSEYNDEYETDVSSNNSLHRAILCGDRGECYRLIDLHCNNYIFLNKKSLGNTPLLLALKVGLFGVALRLAVNVEVECVSDDTRGYTALHYACLFRCNSVIRALLSRGYSVKDFHSHIIRKQRIEDILRFLRIQQSLPVSLYESEWDYDSFNFDEGFQIVDGPGFNVKARGAHKFAHSIFTDLLFHVKRLCTNLDFMNEDDFPRFTEGKYLKTAVFYKKCVQQGLPSLIEFINSQEINNDLLSELNNADYDLEDLKPASFKK